MIMQDRIEAPRVPPSSPDCTMSSIASGELADSVLDMKLDGEAPPPGKIRRRNALTEDDTFSLALMIQKMENVEKMANIQSDFQDMSITKRKKPVPRVQPALLEPPEPGKTMQVSLHRDLLLARRSQSVVPDKILEHYRKKETHAVILYRPPSEIVEDILNKAKADDLDTDEEDESTENKQNPVLEPMDL